MNWDGDENIKEGEDRKIYYEERKSKERQYRDGGSDNPRSPIFSLWIEQTRPEYN